MNRPKLIAVEPTLEQLAREIVERQSWLKRELASETARADYVRRCLADERGVSFIRPEQFAREFGR